MSEVMGLRKQFLYMANRETGFFTSINIQTFVVDGLSTSMQKSEVLEVA